MKHLLTAAIALTLVGGSAATAQPHGHDKGHDKHESRAERHDNRDNHEGRHDNGKHLGQKKQWARGQHLPAEYRGPERYVDYRQANLRQPPRGYKWVLVEDNYMMVSPTSGLISSILARR